MKKRLSLLLFLVSCFILPGIFVKSATAQVTPDGTTSTTVDAQGNDFTIQNGDRAGNNLFHSFQDFSVPTGGSAFFDNAADIANILSRVTGGNISTIDGLIRANGSANLFLINPAGIVFGEGASLNIGGSFYGSSASSILFEDGEFSATDLENPPLLTINAPIGLSFRDEPGEITNRSFAQNSAEEFVGLEVNPGNTLALIGGNINFEAGEATASGGNIELGGLSEAGTVNINPDGSLSFPDGVTKADINLSNGADVDATGTGGGSVSVNARNLNLSAGEFGSSFIGAGIRAESTSVEAQAGDVTINVAENITLDNVSILNQVDPGGVGNSGNITINTGSIVVTNGGNISASTFGQGNAGSINITATGDLSFDGEDSDGTPTGATSVVNSNAVGDAGGVNIDTANLTLTNGAQVSASNLGQGNAGSVNITATGDLTIDGENSQGFASGATSLVNSSAVGDVGGVTIDTANLTLTNGGRVDATTFGQGNAGLVNITATGDITIDGEDSDGFSSGAISVLAPGAVGDAGGVTIDTANLTLTNGGRVDASTFGEGNAGSVNITATGDLTFDGEDLGGFASGATSLVNPSAEGDAGGVTIDTANLTLTNGGRVDASTFSKGDAGLVNITATGDITIDGETSNLIPSGATSLVNSNAVGDAGGVTIDTANLTLTNGGRVSANTNGQGNAGLVDITATGDLTFDGETLGGTPSGATSSVSSGAEGDAGGVTIDTANLTLTNGGRVDASTFGRGNAGSIDITATGDLTFDGETLGGTPSGATSQVSSGAEGDAGGVTISTTNLTLTNGGGVDASTFAQGNAGSVNITAVGDITFDGEDSIGFASGATSQVNSGAEGDAGGVTIDTTNLTLTNRGRVSASTFGQGNAGNVDINAKESISISGVNAEGDTSSGLFANALEEDGSGGNINVTTNQLSINNGGTIDVGNFDNSLGFEAGTGQPGNIDIEANNLDLVNTAKINAASQSETGEGGNITLRIAEDITLKDESLISAQAFENGNGGNIIIDTNFIVAFPSEPNGNDILASNEAGVGGNIDITSQSIFGLEERTAIPGNGTNDIDASSEFSLTQIATEIGSTEVGEVPDNPIESEQTVAQACRSNIESGNKSDLTINGKGGVTPAPDLPLDSQNISINGNITNSISTIPQPIETSQGKIQPARGVKVTKSGDVILTAYRTDNSRTRLSDIEPNCKNARNLPW